MLYVENEVKDVVDNGYFNYIFYNCSGELSRKDIHTGKIDFVESGVKYIRFTKLEMIVVRYDRENIEFLKIDILTLRKETMTTSAKLIKFFRETEVITDKNIIDVDYKHNKFICVCKEVNRRFAVSVDLVTKDMNVVADWVF